jgi:hypothetical protein
LHLLRERKGVVPWPSFIRRVLDHSQTYAVRRNDALRIVAGPQDDTGTSSR